MGMQICMLVIRVCIMEIKKWELDAGRVLLGITFESTEASILKNKCKIPDPRLEVRVITNKQRSLCHEREFPEKLYVL